MKNIPWYYNKSINWGDTSNLLPTLTIFLSAGDKFLEDTIQKNFLKSRFAFAVHSNLKVEKRWSLREARVLQVYLNRDPGTGVFLWISRNF